jgi:hypothetical protein
MDRLDIKNPFKNTWPDNQRMAFNMGVDAAANYYETVIIPQKIKEAEIVLLDRIISKARFMSEPTDLLEFLNDCKQSRGG